MTTRRDNTRGVYPVNKQNYNYIFPNHTLLCTHTDSCRQWQKEHSCVSQRWCAKCWVLIWSQQGCYAAASKAGSGSISVTPHIQMSNQVASYCLVCILLCFACAGKHILGRLREMSSKLFKEVTFQQRCLILYWAHLLSGCFRSQSNSSLKAFSACCSRFRFATSPIFTSHHLFNAVSFNWCPFIQTLVKLFPPCCL